jgi:hypothetical protein
MLLGLVMFVTIGSEGSGYSFMKYSLARTAFVKIEALSGNAWDKVL